ASVQSASASGRGVISARGCMVPLPFLFSLVFSETSSLDGETPPLAARPQPAANHILGIQQLAVARAGIRSQFSRNTIFGDSSVFDNNDSVESSRVTDIVRDRNQCGVVPVLPSSFKKCTAAAGVQPAGGFIQYHQPCVRPSKRPADSNSLALASG